MTAAIEQPDLRLRLYCSKPAFRSNLPIEARVSPVRDALQLGQERYRDECLRLRALEIACCEALREEDARRRREENEHRRESERRNEAEQKAERDRRRKRRLDQIVARERKARPFSRLQKKRIGQGNTRDLRRRLRNQGRVRGDMVDYGAVDGDTRVGFYRRRQTNNSASTLCDVLGQERWKKVRVVVGDLSNFIVD